MAESGGRCEWGQSVCRGGESGCRAHPPSGLSSRFGCGVEDAECEAWGLDWSLVVGPVGGGWEAAGMRIYTFPRGVVGLLEASNFGGTPL